MSKRIACVLIPDFPLVVQLRDQQELCGRPVVLADNGSSRSKVLFMNIQAANGGVSPDMTVVQARNISPEICVLKRDPQKEQYRFDDLLRKLYKFSPFVEEGESGIAYLDATGFRRTYPHEKDLAQKLIGFVKLQGYPVKVGMASNKFTSLVAASIIEIFSHTVVPNDKEKEFLESQSIQLLPVDLEVHEKLYRLGIKTMGQFAVLPDREVTARFGTKGLRLLKLARGQDEEPLEPKRFDEKDSQNRELESPLETEIGILFYINSLLEKQLSELSQKGLSCEKVLVILKTEDKNEIPLHLSLNQGTNKTKAFINLLRLELEKITLPAPVREIQVSIKRASPILSEQLSLYKKKNANHLCHILTPLKRIIGSGNILIPKIVSSHKPEGKFRLVTYTPYSDRKLKESKKTKKSQKKTEIDLSESPFGFCQKSISGLRLYSTPKPATVRTEDGLIKFVIADNWYGDVIRQSGPWEISGEWWTQCYDRRYFDIELSAGEQYLIFFDNSSKSWFLQGVFD